MLANVEALAGGESSNSEGRLHCPYDGYGCQVNYTNGTSQIFWGLSLCYTQKAIGEDGFYWSNRVALSTSLCVLYITVVCSG
jgi:hypothetical protein